MKNLLIVSVLFLLQACSEPTPKIVEQAPVVVQMSKVVQVNSNKEYEFPATVSAVKDVDLKFEVSGRLIVENLVEGSEVAKGQVLAQIDPAPFQRKVDESRTRHQDAARSLSRIKEMHSKNVASQRELDDAESLFTITEIALENAKQDLSYCTIKAPYDAVVGARFIENNSYIRAGDTIANLQDRSQLYFSFEVPERIMTANAGNRNVKATAYIIGQEEQVFDIHYVEHKTTPDPVTQTYDIRFAIDGEVTNLFFPGSRATVKIEDLNQAKHALVIPINALVGDKTSGFFVWRFNEVKGVVEKANVDIADLNQELAVIASGLMVGDKVVSAAVSQMREEMNVKEYKADF
ncbi:efflux RND transporter periplasmic adaptor subunit [Thalassotalea sp. M1531]|uniref:Efflux RND transporter periplasmic adaptor subunit n=1 Tax=Thalassotalea algicola TaxID=2716224 RepID=A0A7Y0LDA8_9GAMM|nr:efflux RND transporter periplasmic adaptor subunit [Thalassotalea algicola]NMP31501.1 efflux RND transporter periplasmic adaptor subunit [Thalassotalea algicola]